ncbi:MAG: alpha/beta fold hydrolase [Lysobacteraceae bacterium]|uniref:alpha/beta fold hydrolase n=1 Tax=Denitratimonas sp. CY0512 TaxID=3131940 RepID=UPI0030AD9CAE
MSYPDYPFTPQRFQVRPGIAMSYLDEGPRDGEIVLMLHGNPSWSYYWRKLVSGLSDRYRCIVPDHVGMGLSDKPGDADYDYTLASRIDDLATLLAHLGIDGKLTLAVHDWGGMIGFGWALRDPSRIARLVVLNTAAFPLPAEKPMPWQLKLGRDSRLGALAIRGFNAFSSAASRVGVCNAMPPDVRAAYVAPYNSWANRIATLRFVQDIPLAPGDKAWALVEESGRRLHEYADRPALLAWGLRDFVFDAHFLRGFEQKLPQAQSLIFDDAGHYVLEDKAAQIVPQVRRFLDAHPL